MEYFASLKKTIAAAFLTLAAIAFSLPAVAVTANHLYIGTSFSSEISIERGGETVPLNAQWGQQKDLHDVLIANADFKVPCKAPQIVGWDFLGWFRPTPAQANPYYYLSFPGGADVFTVKVCDQYEFVPEDGLDLGSLYNSHSAFYAPFVIKYSPATYKVSFANPSTEEWSQPQELTATGGASITLPEGYKLSLDTGVSFKGWYSDSACTEFVGAGGAVYRPTDHITLYAKLVRDPFTVTFDPNGGETPAPSAKSVYYGEPYGTLAKVERPGYEFLGWFTGFEDGERVTETSIYDLKRDSRLYAHWSEMSYSVSVVSTNAIVTVASSAAYQDVLQIECVSTGKTGYDYAFRGLTIRSSASEGARELADFKSDRGLTFQMSRDARRFYSGIVITAGYDETPKTFTVSFDANRGSVAETSRRVTYDSTYGALPVPTRDGYVFAGWWTEKVDGKEVKGDDTVDILSNITLYARWTYTIAFAKGDDAAVGEMASLTATWDVPVALPPNAFTLTGNRFARWRLSGSSVSYADEDEVTNLPVTGGVALLTAEWEPISYLISFDANWDYTRLGTMTNEAPAAVTKDYGAALPLEEWGPDNTLAPFLGWGLAQTGDVLVADGGTLESDLSDGDPVTLYAIWDLPDMKLSDAVGCRNVPLESKKNYQTYLGTAEAWQVGETGIVSGKVTANNLPAQTQSNLSSNLELYLSGPGKLTFTWALRTAGAGRGTYFIRDEGTQAIRESGEATAAGETVTYENGEDDYVKITWQGYGVFTKAKEECPGNLVITSMTWIPAGFEPVHPEPTEKDRPVISADYSFETSSDFDYVIWKKDDLTAAEWTKLKTVTGDGQPVTLPMFVGPQGFFKVEVIQRQ